MGRAVPACRVFQVRWNTGPTVGPVHGTEGPIRRSPAIYVHMYVISVCPVVRQTHLEPHQPQPHQPQPHHTSGDAATTLSDAIVIRVCSDQYTKPVRNNPGDSPLFIKFNPPSAPLNPDSGLSFELAQSTNPTRRVANAQLTSCDDPPQHPSLSAGHPGCPFSPRRNSTVSTPCNPLLLMMVCIRRWIKKGMYDWPCCKYTLS